MVKYVFMFVIIVAFLFTGSVIQKNPTWLQKYRSAGVKSNSPLNTSPVGSTQEGIRYSDSSLGVTFIHPRTWIQKNEVPGCGPVWFPSETSKVWLTVCNSISSKTLEAAATDAQTPLSTVVSRENISLAGVNGIKQVLQVEGGKVNQIFLPTSKGLLVFYFTNLETVAFAQFDDMFSHLLSTLRLD